MYPGTKTVIRVSSILLVLICVWIGTMTSSLALASETDQYTPPPAPLVDIGPFISQTFYQSLQTVIQNAPPGANIQTIRHGFFNSWARGIPYTKLELWMARSKSLPKGAVFKMPQKNSIYKGFIGHPTPGSLFVLAPTINMYGVYFGTDKLGHLVQQGYGSLMTYQKGLAHGLTPAQAQENVVQRNVEQERTYFGTWLDGVYSNGDLAGDFAGLKFYRNFEEPVQIGGKIVPPILVQVEDRWKINPSLNPADMMRPFISDHLNEMLNPSLYIYSQTRLRKAIQDRQEVLERAKSYYPLQPSEDVSLWRGENYGHNQGKGHAFPLAEVCPSLVNSVNPPENLPESL